MKKQALAIFLILTSFLCFSESLDSILSEDSGPDDVISRLSNSKIEYSVSEGEETKIITAKNIEVYTPDSNTEDKIVLGDILMYFKDDRLYKTATKHHDANLYQKAMQQAEIECSGNKTELESGKQYIIEDEGIICTLSETNGEYTMELEFNRSLIPVSVPWYKVRLHPEDYAGKTVVLDNVVFSMSGYVGEKSDWIGIDEDVVLFNAETDGDYHVVTFQQTGINFRFCMGKNYAEGCLQAAHDENGTRMILSNAKCRLYKARGQNNNWYVEIVEIPWWDTGASTYNRTQYK